MRLKVAFTKIIAAVSSGILLFCLTLNKPSAQVSSDVDVYASVTSCILEVRVLPEKRIPPTNNWQTTLTIQIHAAGSPAQLGVATANSNSFGTATVNLCDLGYNFTTGNYDFYIRGKSHLRKLYPNVFSFQTATSTIDLSAQGLMLAGETSVFFDNYINVLDISTQVTNIFTTIDLYNLNQDSRVNILDISNTITNYLLVGE